MANFTPNDTEGIKDTSHQYFGNTRTHKDIKANIRRLRYESHVNADNACFHDEPLKSKLWAAYDKCEAKIEALENILSQ